MEDDNTLPKSKIYVPSPSRVESQPKMFTIFIKTMAGKILSLLADPNYKIEEIKSKVQDEVGIISEEQKLIFEGKELEDKMTLAWYNIVAGSTFNLFLRDKMSINVHTTRGHNFKIFRNPEENEVQKEKLMEKIFEATKIVPEKQLLFKEENLEEVDFSMFSDIILIDLNYKGDAVDKKKVVKNLFSCSCKKCKELIEAEQLNLEIRFYLEDFITDRNTFIITRSLSEGAQGKVYEVKNSFDKLTYAMKEYNFEKERKEIFHTAEMLEIRKELYLQKLVRDCPNICKVINFTENKERCCAIFDLYQCDLDVYMSQNRKIGNKEFLQIIGKLTNALAYMQKCLIIHRDIKPKNILVSQIGGDLDVALTDFGIAQKLDQNTVFSISGTKKWMSPELIKELNQEDKICEPREVSLKSNKKIQLTKAFASDVFSFGLVWLFLIGYEKYPSKMIFNIDAEALDKFIESNRSFFYDSAMEPLFILMNNMLRFNPAIRPDFQEIEDALLFSFHCPYRYYTSLNSTSEGSEFKDSVITLKEEGKSQLKGSCFNSQLHLKQKVPEKYLLAAMNPDFSPKPEELIKNILSKYKIVWNKIEEDRIKKHLKREFNDFDRLIYLYTRDSDFQKQMNKDLAKECFQQHIEYINTIIRLSSLNLSHALYIPKEIICYKICQIERGDYHRKSRDTRLSFFHNARLYFPSFSKVSKNLEKVLQMVSNPGEFDYIIFKIKLNLQNKRNKFDLSLFNQIDDEEPEILLLPYFRFSVNETYPKAVSIQGKVYNLLEIYVEELSENSLPVQLVWFDPQIDSKENKAYQNVFTEYFHLSPCSFQKTIPETVSLIKEAEKNIVFFLISCGSKGKELMDQISGFTNIIHISLFCFQSDTHKKWFNSENYWNYFGIFNNFNQLQTILPKVCY